MITPRFIAGCSGHRDLSDPGTVSEALHKVWRRLKEKVVQRGGKLEVYSSIAYGADTLAVESAQDRQLLAHLILPKPVVFLKEGGVDIKAGFAADFWTPAQGGQPAEFRTGDWERAMVQITAAQAAKHGASFRLTRGSQSEPECYYDTGLDMLECCDVLVAVWDGAAARGLGGTAHLVEHARKLGMPLVIIDPDTGKITEERLELFAARGDTGCAAIEEVDRFSKAHASGAIIQSETAGQFFDRLEACSNDKASQFRDYLVRIIKIHGCATLVAAVACILPHSGEWRAALAALALAEFCMVAWALLRTQKLNEQYTHEHWIKTRFATELVRAIKTSGGLLDPLYPLVARHDPAWRRFAITLGLMIHQEQSPTTDWRASRQAYVTDRLWNPDIARGQIRFFRKKQAQAAPHFQRTVRWSSNLTKAAAIFVFGAFLYKMWGWLGESAPVASAHSEAQGWSLAQAVCDVAFRLLPIALPLAAGIFLSLRAALDSGRRTYRYRELADFLTNAAVQLEALQTEASVRRAVAEIEEVLLDELIEWRLVEQQNGGH